MHAVWSFVRCGLMLAGVGLLTACGPPPIVPTDAQDLCPLSSSTFSGWFQSGTVSLNGVVNPADSTQNLSPDCDFYAWGNQMFPMPTVTALCSRMPPASFDPSRCGSPNLEHIAFRQSSTGRDASSK